MKKLSKFAAGLLLLGLILISSCSRGGSNDGFANIKVMIAGRGTPYLAGFDLMEQIASELLFTTPPNSVANFNCLMVNVIGPGISPSNSSASENWLAPERFARILSHQSACTYPGIMSQTFTLGVAGQSVQLRVPSGLRVIQVLGVQDPSSYICGMAAPHLSYLDPANYQFYELGHAALSLFSNTQVGIQDVYPIGASGLDDEKRSKHMSACPAHIYEPAIFSDSGLIAYWKMNALPNAMGPPLILQDDKGGIGPLGLVNSSNMAFGEVGALAGNFDPAVTFGTPTANSYAQNLNGGNFINGVGGPGSFSFEFWVRPTNCASNPTFVSMYHLTPTNDSIELGCGSTSLNFTVTHNSVPTSTAPALPTPGLWHHIVGVGDTVACSLYLYSDGVLAGSTPYTPGSVLNFTSLGSKTRLGINKLGAGFLQGGLDEVAIYARPLTAAEVFVHYNIGIQSLALGQ